MGPLKVIRRIADRCPEEIVEEFDEQMLLVDDRRKAAGGFEQLVRPGRRLTKAFEATADSLALGLLDSWAEIGDDPGAEVSGLVVEALGKRVAHLEFDSGLPGSGQSLSAWRLGAQVFLVGESGAYGICGSLAGVITAWCEFEVDISCPGLGPRAIKAMDLDLERPVRINGDLWMASGDGQDKMLRKVVTSPHF